MESVAQDFRFTVRQLLKNKSFTLTAVLSLALGIGATTAVFSVVYGVLMDPYPYKDANRMVHELCEFVRTLEAITTQSNHSVRSLLDIARYLTGIES